MGFIEGIVDNTTRKAEPKIKQYKIGCFMRVDVEDEEPMSLEEAEKELEHLRFIQPENRYELEEIEEVD